MVMGSLVSHSLFGLVICTISCKNVHRQIKTCDALCYVVVLNTIKSTPNSVYVPADLFISNLPFDALYNNRTLLVGTLIPTLKQQII